MTPFESNLRPEFLVMNDFKFAIRQLLKSPGFTALAVLTLALGIGATSTVFSLIQGVLLTPPPFPNPEKLMLITSSRQDGQPYTRGLPAAQWTEWQKESKTFETIAAYGWTFNFLVLPDGSQSMEGMRVTPEYFKVMGVKPLLGRPFDDSDVQGNRTTTVILGHGLWQKRFNSDPNIIGQTIQISRNSQRQTVVGIMPPGIRFLPSPNVAQEPNYNENAQVDYWLPARVPPEELKRAYTYVVGRLRPDATPEAAQAEISSMAARQAAGDADFAGINTHVEPLEHHMNREGRRLLFPMAGAVGLVFLIACGNAAGLLLARGLARQHEYAVRSALGAGSFQLCKPILAESLLLSLSGGVLGVVLSLWSVDLLKLLAGAGIPRLDAVRVGWPLFAFCLGASLLAGMFAGLLPALRSIGRDPARELKAGSRTASVGGPERRLLGRVAAAQVALTLALLVGAGLLIQTVRSLANIRPGYDVENILTMSVTSVGTNSQGFHQEAVVRVGQLPGIKAAAFAWGVPLTGNKWENTFEIEGQPEARSDKERPVIGTRSVTQDYFTLMGLKLIEGRAFSSTDDQKSPRVVIVNQAFAAKYFPGRKVVGKTMWFPGNRTNSFEIAGLLADTRTDSLTQQAEPEVYFSFWQMGAFSKHLVMRTAGDPNLMAVSVLKELRSIDPTVSVENIKTLADIRSDSVASRTFAMNLLVGFAIVACLLAAVGIYGVLSLAVGSRQTEIAIRMAVGAQRRDVLHLMLGDGFRMAALGVGVGILIALGLAMGLKTYLFEITPADPLVLGMMILAVMVLTLVTCWIPARRASRVDPLVALRSE